MKNIYSNIFYFNRRILNKIINCLRSEKVVSLPTETVYGLAGNAYSKKSISRIFMLKKRPNFNPLIVHYYNKSQAENDVIFNKNFIKLYKKFCPGPLTFILKKKWNSNIHSKACANLKTVAIRFPRHRIIRNVLKKTIFPLAMPSANLSSRLSPVNALDVYEDFKKNIPMIINGGVSKIGIESTVIDLTGQPKILRPGIIDSKKIEKVLKIKLKNYLNPIIKSPGMLKKHYSPGIPIFLNQKNYDKKSAYVYIGKKYIRRKSFFSLSKKSDLREAASNLYKTLRKIKKKGFKSIQFAKIPHYGPGIAINDRIKRAAK